MACAIYCGSVARLINNHSASSTGEGEKCGSRVHTSVSRTLQTSSLVRIGFIDYMYRYAFTSSAWSVQIRSGRKFVDQGKKSSTGKVRECDIAKDGIWSREALRCQVRVRVSPDSLDGDRHNEGAQNGECGGY